MNANSAPIVAWPSITFQPPYHSTATCPSPSTAVNSGMRMANSRMTSTLRSVTSLFTGSKRARCMPSCAKARTTRAPARFSCTVAFKSAQASCTAWNSGRMRCANVTASTAITGTVSRDSSASCQSVTSSITAAPTSSSAICTSWNAPMDTKRRTRSTSLVVRDINSPVRARSW